MIKSIMKNKIFLLILVGSVGFLNSCQLFKKSKTPDVANLKNIKQFEQLLELQLANQNFDWMLGNARVKIKSKSQNISLSAQIKSKKDSLVWLRLSKLLEVVRAQADANHFQLINRLDRTFVDYGFEELADYVDPKEGLAAMQNMLLGTIPFSLEGAFFAKAENGYLITVKDSISQKALVDNQRLKLLWYEIAQDSKGTKATATFDDYIETEYGWVPQMIRISITGADLETIALEFSKIEFKKREKVDFEIPSGYKEN